VASLLFLSLLATLIRRTSILRHPENTVIWAGTWGRSGVSACSPPQPAPSPQQTCNTQQDDPPILSRYRSPDPGRLSAMVVREQAAGKRTQSPTDYNAARYSTPARADHPRPASNNMIVAAHAEKRNRRRRDVVSLDGGGARTSAAM
jgi:hypothetical protein